MKLCVAFDLASFDECVNLAKELKGLDLWIKIGLRSYLRDGIKLIESIKSIDEFKIFLDLKLYDIPNTMADACEELAKIDVDMINIHASAGKTAMVTIMDRLNALNKRPLVLAVSALTSFDNDEFQNLYHQDVTNAVKNFSKISYESGLDGMVCSVYESLLVKESTNKNFITLTPGIRPFKEEANDQKRVANIQCAKENLSDFIVIGRPIYKASEPRAICQEILTCI
ncbi:orotidine-5'-phosphate decarboxylase [Campylobacter insulaenigrae]|uniref:orotidine-5'-phosphate decarboxylase n=1 Tax=Campylobacter insulaenigrae TaxID=260714 RepID=UPI002152F35D|nr:orotidine-5'-phosphate decarboxylase [Campylobacter insulaenigrae]MCR6570809.1 orotidine-5'-phosphate decarboxylase [Campylobacter insulaenigrae]MCR6573503.1 orotidine-5'-phosphate decarboxylase [Campylobacter insulaenigrae]MCR6580008.1 orotidine-5'-phosphate decarboxylase [Campylobacter insulaenigrae]MCR6586092.1 orotidine-5'-phosphate decarboxylase [Campylobacter insulaenigrae]